MAFVWYSTTLDWSTKLATGTFGVFHLINRRLHSAISTAPPKLDQIILISTTLHHTPHIHRQKETMCQSTSCSTCRKYPHPIITRTTPPIMHLYLPTCTYLPIPTSHSDCISLLAPTEGTTWYGCGSHIPSVLDSVPQSERCDCGPQVERNGKMYPPGGELSSSHPSVPIFISLALYLNVNQWLLTLESTQALSVA
jgi:hypothetical protein